MTLTAEQLAQRRTGLGASEIAAIVGLDPYRSAFDVYLEKRGLVEPFAGNTFTEWGNRIEPVLCAAYAEKMGVHAIECGTIRHPGEAWILATPDRIIVPAGTNVVGWDEGAGIEIGAGAWGLEVKNRNARNADAWGASGTDEVPDEVACQAHWGMIATGLERWDVAVLLGGNEFRTYTLRRDDDVARELVEAGRRFWRDHIEADVPPPIEATDAAEAWIKKRFARETTPDLAEADAATEERIAYLLDLKDQAKGLEAAIARAELELKQLIGDRAGVAGAHYRVTWKADKQGRATFDREALAAAGALDPARIRSRVETTLRGYGATEAAAREIVDGILLGAAVDLAQFEKRGEPARRFLPAQIGKAKASTARAGGAV